MSLSDRIAKLEQRSSATHSGVLIVEIVGGPTPAGVEPRFAGVGGSTIDRAPTETLNDFKLRVRRIATSNHATHVVLRAFPSRTLPEVELSPCADADP
jgi:hypothetical protein